MAAGSDWRVIEPTEDEGDPREHAAAADRVPRWLIGAIVAIVGAACALAIWATLPAGRVALDATDAPFDPRAVTAASAGPGSSFFAHAAGQKLVVDLEGAVAQPGVRELADGSRVGDAIEAAGGYAQNVDIAAASRILNLASKLTDGQQIHVPALGDGTSPTNSAAGDGSAPGTTVAGGLIDLNHASADELDTLPGIGPVTAAKIIDARTQAPFANVDELQSRGVVGESTLEKLRDLATVSP